MEIFSGNGFRGWSLRKTHFKVDEEGREEREGPHEQLLGSTTSFSFSALDVETHLNPVASTRIDGEGLGKGVGARLSGQMKNRVSSQKFCRSKLGLLLDIRTKDRLHNSQRADKAGE